LRQSTFRKSGHLSDKHDGEPINGSPCFMPNARFALVVNAGGESRRMGRAKARLPVPGTHLPLITHIIQRMMDLVTLEIIVVTNDPTLLAECGLATVARAIPDAYPGSGPLGGIATGLRHCSDWAMVIACDLPLINPQLFAYLQQLALEQAGSKPRWQAVVPVVNGHEQPLHALYHPSTLPAMEQALATGERRATSFLPQVATRWVTEAELRPLDPALLSFFNTNTPEEWAEACRLLA
jgi:molybdopterin-guanine dinucleotide biosynthesis protein A